MKIASVQGVPQPFIRMLRTDVRLCLGFFRWFNHTPYERLLRGSFLLLLLHGRGLAADSAVLTARTNLSPAASSLRTGEFQWRCSEPLLSAANRPEDPCYSVKDPSIVYFEGRWHLFCTIRSQKRTHQIEYLSFTDWKEAANAPRHILAMTNGYFCAPQVFYFTPHRKWYLIYQVNDSKRKMLQPACS